MTKTQKIISGFAIIIAIIAVCAVVLSTDSSRAETASAAVDAPTSVVIGEEFDIPVSISNVVDLDAGQFDITIDKTRIEILDITDGLVGSVVTPVMWNEISDGTYRVVFNIPDLDGTTGDGYMAILRCKGLQECSTDILISNGFINNIQALEIDATFSGDSMSFFRVYDPNGDGVSNTSDITFIERVILGIDGSSVDCDTTEDGQINTADVTGFEIYLLGV